MFNPKAWLFDLDGTLLDTAPDLGHALNFVLGQNNLPLCALEESKNHSSDGALGLLKIGFKNKLEHYDVEQLRGQFLEYYHDNLAKHTRPYQGVKELLATLDDKKIPWGIVTNKPTYLTERLIPQYACFNNCQLLICGDTYKQRKPDPFVMLEAAKKLHVHPETCIYVGDAQRDMQAANSAGMFSVLAKYGYIKANENIELWQSKVKVNDVASLQKLFLTN